MHDYLQTNILLEHDIVQVGLKMCDINFVLCPLKKTFLNKFNRYKKGEKNLKKPSLS